MRWVAISGDRGAAMSCFPASGGSRAGGPKSRRGMLCCFAAAAAVPLSVHAAEKDWKPTVTSGSWSVAGNWVQNTIPAAGDDAFIATAHATTHVATYEFTNGATFFLGTLHGANT